MIECSPVSWFESLSLLIADSFIYWFLSGVQSSLMHGARACPAPPPPPPQSSPSVFLLWSSLFTVDQDWWFLLDSSVISASPYSCCWELCGAFTAVRFPFEIPIEFSKPEAQAPRRPAAQRAPLPLQRVSAWAFQVGRLTAYAYVRFVLQGSQHEWLKTLVWPDAC